MYLGIDLGTSGVKVVLLDEAQQLAAVADAPLAVSHPQPLWSEQAPHSWWLALDRAMQQLRHAAPGALAQVRALGLSGQMHGAVLLDARQHVLRPAILWNDGRAFAQCAQLEAAEPRSRAITGNLVMPGFTAPKLLWLRQHEAAVFAQTRTVLCPKDWLRLQLTGEAVSDMSDASGTLWLDVGVRRWSEPMLAACGLTLAHMPRLVEGSAPGGSLRPGIAQAWGLPAGVVVAGGAGDNAASAVGMGVVRGGEGFVSLGTSGVIFLATDAFRPAPAQAVHAFAHALPGRWHQMSVMLSAASALAWAARLTGRRSEAALLEEVALLQPARRAQAPLFLPYLSGERTPHNNTHASASFTGLRQEHGAADIGYAVIEGVSFGLMDGFAAMRGGGPLVNELALVGGGARSDLWAQLLACGLGCALRRHEGAHAAAAMGAARLGWLADGGDEAQVCRAPLGGRLFEPNAMEAALLRPRYQRFRALYPALAPHFADTPGGSA
ncbi:xylulokinase [Rhodoferax sediminis]|uniref:Xylulose kinase n=1 Tax=Rhodoferax sediminis TaxID=2509614 RepID=A0A515D8Z6_9BURK|nr:xylulokinase [Rhodoferax sediminis]QDL36875.1 xylulokinase [Rhodoferax sediminis]